MQKDDSIPPPRGLKASVRPSAACLCQNPVATNLPVPGEELPPLPPADNELTPPAGHPGQDPAEENLPSREDLPGPTPPAEGVWDPGTKISAITSQPEEAAAAAWGEEMR